MHNKNVLITGSSRGIGLSIAHAFANDGANVMINTERDIDELLSAKKELSNLKGNVAHCLADVSIYEECRFMFDEFHKSFHSFPDVLINNAGISQIGLFTDTYRSHWERMIGVNLMSVMNCTHIALSQMIKNQRGLIINISSIWGEVGASCEAVYSATKGGVNAFTKSIAKEVGPSNIRVNAISCGVIETGMNDWLEEDERLELMNQIPLMKFGTPESIASLCMYLTQNDFITGQIIRCDGGML